MAKRTASAARKVIVDTGPLVAMLRGKERMHQRVVDFMALHQPVLMTTWAVVAEVCHFLPTPAAAKFLRWVQMGGMDVTDLDTKVLIGIADLMEKYGDIPMDFADASLVWLAEQRSCPDILTLDERGFRAFRGLASTPFRLVLQED